MKKRILNILIIISIVFISMFANKKVEAKTYCKYYTYSPIVMDGKVLWGSYDGKHSVSGAGHITFEYSDPLLGSNMRFTSIQDLNFSSSSFENIVEMDGCPDFIIIYYKGGGAGLEVKNTGKNTNSFYKGDLIYDPLSDDNYRSVQANLPGNYGYRIDVEQSIKAGKEMYLFREGFEKSNTVFQYKHDVYNDLVSNESENDAKAKLEACGISYSDGGIALQYYQQTKEDVYDAISKATKDCKTECMGLPNVYSYWYLDTSYVMLEYDPEYLLWFYKKIYHNLDDNTDYENCVSFLESLVDVKKIEDKKDKYDDNNKDDGEKKIPICNYYCKNENGDAEESCRRSDAFKHCKYCYSIPQDAEKNKCLEQYKKQAERNEEELEKKLEDNKEKLWKKFSGISAPTLDIDFDKHYKLTCDDVSFFHWFYVVLRILAPVAVIFFGTLDYAKAVIASDVEKMNKSKKNFPKRLILLILFITVPLIISLLLSIFGGDYSLMDCIINGE